MRKLFRFKYEPCNGTCYTGGDDFYECLRQIGFDSKAPLVTLIVNAHDKLCDNPNFYFGLDKCEKTGLFIGHFIQPTRTDLFTGATMLDAIQEMCEFILATEIPQLKGICEFGNSGTENLAYTILAACA